MADYRGAQGIILVYDTTRAKTFESVKNWLVDVEHFAPGVPLLLVGNKVDLVEERQVTPELAEECAREIGAPCLEIYLAETELKSLTN